MKKDFEKFQNDFYAEVEKSLPEFNDATYTFMITDKVPGTDKKSNDFLEVIFAFIDVTGKNRTESIVIDMTDDVKVAVTELNKYLKAEYPAFAHFNGLKDVITTAIEIGDDDNNYQVCLEGDGDLALVYVNTHYDVLGNLLVTVRCPEEDYIETFTAKATPEEIESTVRLDIFGELDEE